MRQLGGWRWTNIIPIQITDNYAPAVPSNFSGSVQNNNPYLSWNANTEGDFDYYEVWRKFDEGPYQGSWVLKTTTTSTSYTDTDFIINGKNYVGIVYYKIRAKDINGHFSDYTSVTSFDYTGTTWKLADKVTNSSNNDYSLESNYPNPFNPTTIIKFQIPKSTYVKLSVYNFLGQEVALLINDYLEKGVYKTEFNAKDLPSGVYVYKLQSEQFSDSKKMILAK